MRTVLSRAGGSNVVGPGEPMDITDVASYPDRLQHSYTAVTTELGVIVWYTGEDPSLRMPCFTIATCGRLAATDWGE